MPSDERPLPSAADLERQVREKIRVIQAGVPTSFDNVVLAGVRRLREAQMKSEARVNAEAYKVHELFRRYATFTARAPLVGYGERAAETDRWSPLPWEPSELQLNATQGVEQCLSWRGLPLFKSVFDFAMYPMLIWNVRPSTIVELGSGTGASALWFADLLRLFRIDGHVFSLDLRAPPLVDPSVTFLEGDGRAIDTVMSKAVLDRMPHPWVVIEDMHVNTLDVLRHFSKSTRPGDYLIVEDSIGKRGELAAFDRDCGGAFRVDTRYTDFFGRNTTYCPDSIFIRVAPGVNGEAVDAAVHTAAGEDPALCPVIEL